MAYLSDLYRFQQGERRVTNHKVAHVLYTKYKHLSDAQNKVALEMRHLQCSHPDVLSSKLEDVLVQDFVRPLFSVEDCDCLVN